MQRIILISEPPAKVEIVLKKINRLRRGGTGEEGAEETEIFSKTIFKKNGNELSRPDHVYFHSKNIRKVNSGKRARRRMKRWKNFTSGGFKPKRKMNE